MKKTYIRKEKFDEMSQEERSGLFPWGEFADIDRPEFVAGLHDLARIAKENQSG